MTRNALLAANTDKTISTGIDEMSELTRDRTLRLDADSEGATRRRLVDWGDRLCCAALLAAGLAGCVLLAWYIFQMPGLR